MHRIIFIFLALYASGTLAQNPSSEAPANIKQLREAVEKNPPDKQKEALNQSLRLLVEKIARLKKEDPHNPTLFDLIELRILISPIVVLAKNSQPITEENCKQTQHEIQYMQNIENESADNGEVLLLLKLFCPKLI